MFIEVHAYFDQNTKSLVRSIVGGENYTCADRARVTLVAIRQLQRSYGEGRNKNLYEMVCADGTLDLFKAVVNSGLSHSLEDSMQ